MALYLVSMLAIVAAPFAIGALRRTPGAIAFFDAFVMVSVGGLVVLQILPHTVDEGGSLALVAALGGLLLPLLIHALFDKGRARGRDLTLFFGLLGLALHSLFDGVALANGHDHGHGRLLAFAVVLHRLPVGIAIWWVVRPRFSRCIGAIVLSMILVATSVGYWGGEAVHPLFHDGGWPLFQAFIAGALLHVAVGHRKVKVGSTPGAWEKGASIAGAILAGVALWLLTQGHPMYTNDKALSASVTLTTLTLQCAPSVLLAYLLSGVLWFFFPKWPSFWSPTGAPWSHMLRATLGLPLSICSCTVLPLYQGLLARGVTMSAGVTFLVAAPEISLASALLSVQLLGTGLGAMRIVAACLLALGTGVGVGRMACSTGHSVPCDEEAMRQKPAKLTLEKRLLDGVRYGLGEVVDHTMPWLIAGLGVAAVVEPLLSPDHIGMVPPALQVPLLAIVGLPLYVRASGATPFIAVLIHKGLSPGAAVAFLLSGPATNISTFKQLAKVHNRRFSMVFAGAVVIGASACGFLVDQLFTNGARVPLHAMAAEGHPTWNWICVVVLAGVSLLSLLRLGIQGVVAQVFSLHGPAHLPGCHGHHHHQASQTFGERDGVTEK